MSLLMDALRRAEASKNDTVDDPAKAIFPTGPATLTLEEFSPEAPATNAQSSGQPEPPPSPPEREANLEITALEDPPPRAPTLPRPAPEAPDRRAAAAVFAAKTAVVPGVWRQRAPFLALIGFLVVAGGGLAYYVWAEVDRLARPQAGALTTARPIITSPPAPVPVIPPPVSTPAPDPTPPAVPQPAAAPAPSTRPSPVTAITRSEPSDPVFRRNDTTPSGRLRPTSPAQPLRALPAPSADLLLQAHAALQRGEREPAQRLFQEALRNDPHNVDTLVGLASLALDRGDVQTAESLYFRAMEANPKSAAAQAGLINLHGQRDPAFSESRLKVLLGNLPSGSPAAGGVLFVLGNLYARQSRWNEAQRAYFEAHGIDAGNPDYQFNLAVALEHLQKPAIALDYYRGALSAASQRAASFDQQQVQDRIEALSAPRQ